MIVVIQTISIIVLSLLFTLLNFNFITKNQSLDYLFYNADRGDLVFKSFWSFYLVLNRFVPFELVIIIEMCKIHYSMYITWDATLWNEETGEGPMVHNLTLLEDCGEIKYLFCDKTGTLTQNKLIFREIGSMRAGVTFPETEEDMELLRCILLCNECFIVNGENQCSNQDD